MTISLGFSLKWIHIYLIPLHRLLILLWAIGSLGLVFLSIFLGTKELLYTIKFESKWTWIIGPLFAALTGIGFKEFFCFRRAEAIGITIIVPLTLLGHITNIINNTITFSLLS